MAASFEQLSHQLALGKLPHRLLRGRPNAMVAAVEAPQSQETVVIKIWKKPGFSGLLRRISRTGNVHREWQVMNRLFDNDVRVPKPLGMYPLASAPGGYTDAVVMSYFEDSDRGIEHLRVLTEQGKTAQRLAFEESVLDLTEAVLAADVLDADHHLVNILAVPSNQAVRVDFEIARVCRNADRSPALYGKMLGALLSTYLFGVQPHIELADSFSEGLLERLKPPRIALDRAKEIIQARIRVQHDERGIHTPWTPSW